MNNISTIAVDKIKLKTNIYEGTFMAEKLIKLTWLGHSGFKIEYKNTKFLIDPWFSGNPMFPIDKRTEALDGSDFILISHAHSDHSADVVTIAKEKSIPIVGIYDLMQFYETFHAVKTMGFNKGGTISLGEVSITMVSASHSSSFQIDGKPFYGGAEVGYMISTDEKTIYFSGDTDVMADMQIFSDLHNPEVGILCCGGHFTMDMKRAAYAAEKFFNFETLIPCHYRTFPILEQSAHILKKSLPEVKIIEPKVLDTFSV